MLSGSPDRWCELLRAHAVNVPDDLGSVEG
jgi:hypothetical protein